MAGGKNKISSVVGFSSIKRKYLRTDDDLTFII